MAINTNTPRTELTATSGQTNFEFNFKVFAASDIVAYLTPSGQTSNDTNDLLTLSTDYTVSINGNDGGTLTLLSGASTGDKITITRQLSVTRTVEYQQGGDILAETSNNDQEYQTYLIQDLEGSKSRFMELPSSAQGLSNKLPSPEADQYVRWNSSGTALINDTTIPDSVQLAKDWANKAEDSIVADGEYSSKHYSIKSSDSATAAQTAQGLAEQAVTDAQAVLAQTEQVLDNFDDKYLGSKASDPTLDNDGNALTDGALYFNTTSNEMKVYDLGTTTWIAIPQMYLSTLQDVELTSVSSGDVLQWNGTKWINTTIDTSNFVDLTTAQNVGGIKTFTSFPVTPSAAPTTDYQVANKKYVDDNIGANRVWTNVSGSRTLGVIYTNSTGKHIELSIRVLTQVGAGLYLEVNGNRIQDHSSGSSADRGFFNITIQNNDTYRLVVEAGTTTISSWFELR